MSGRCEAMGRGHSKPVMASIAPNIRQKDEVVPQTRRCAKVTIHKYINLLSAEGLVSKVAFGQ